jgi:CRISPR type IV-associated protein Csf2
MSAYFIEGILKLTSPLHVAGPGERYVMLDNLYIHLRKPTGETPFTGITPTTAYPVAFTQEDLLGESNEHKASKADEEKNTRRSTEVPVFPANDMRGRLRRLAAEVIFESLVTRNEKISLEVYHGMTCGAVTDQPVKGLTFAAFGKSGVHPFLGLFGGGPRLVRSAVQFSPLWAITNTTLKAGIVPMRYEADRVIDERHLLMPLFFRRVDDALEFSTGSASLVVKGYSDAIVDWMLKEGSQKKDGEDETSRSALRIRTFSAVQYVVPGTRFFFEARIDTSRTGIASLGLLIHAIAALANKQSIGGWARNGFGRFETDLSLVLPDGSRLPVLSTQDGKYSPNATGLIEDALDAWAETESKLNVAELEDLYSLPGTVAA